MSYVDLDKIINVTGGGGSGIYLDVPYPVLNQRIGIFNKPNAWDINSNGRFGLLGSSVSGICQQNNNFNLQIASALDSGVGALSTRVKSYNFSTDIDKIDGGVIKFGMFSRGTNFFNINETSKKIKDVYTVDSNLQLTLDSSTKKSWIVTSGGNRFLLIGGDVFPIDSNNKITSIIPTDTYNGDVLAVEGNKIWKTRLVDAGNNGTEYVYGALYSIDSSGVMLVLGAAQALSGAYNNGYPSGQTGLWAGYQADNTIAYVYASTITNYESNGKYRSVDLTNISAFTSTLLADVGWLGAVPNLAGYDGTGLLVVTGTDVKRLTGAGVSMSLGTYFGNTNNLMAKYASLLYYTTKSENICTDNTKFNILGTNIMSGNIVNIYDKISYVYEPTGTLSQDDAFVGVITNIVPIGEIDPVTLSLNSVVVNIQDNSLRENAGMFMLSNIIVAVPVIDLQIDYVNTLGNDIKFGIGITGGTYATPTLPLNNGMSAGSNTAAWVAGSDASYIDLTLST